MVSESRSGDSGQTGTEWCAQGTQWRPGDCLAGAMGGWLCAGRAIRYDRGLSRDISVDLTDPRSRVSSRIAESDTLNWPTQTPPPTTHFHAISRKRPEPTRRAVPKRCDVTTNYHGTLRAQKNLQTLLPSTFHNRPRRNLPCAEKLARAGISALLA